MSILHKTMSGFEKQYVAILLFSVLIYDDFRSEVYQVCSNLAVCSVWNLLGLIAVMLWVAFY